MTPATSSPAPALSLVPSSPASDSVATILTPAERARVDAAGEGVYRALHRESVEDVLRDLRERRASAVLLSVARCDVRTASRMATVVREFPRVPAVALLSQHETAVPHRLLTLGRFGVERLVDVRNPSGWRELRAVLAQERSDPFSRFVLDTLSHDLNGAPDECHRFFHLVFRGPPLIPTVRALARELGVVPSTLMSRFFRAKLPAPKRYLVLGRLTKAARLFENPGLSVAAVANALEYSSPQSFGRHVRTLMGITAVRFRDQYDGEGMLRRFREELVLPHLDVLRRFDPLHVPPGWLS